jgi:ketosteroid isomerase-like protein
MGRTRFVTVLVLSVLAAGGRAQMTLDPGSGKPSAVRPLEQMPVSAGVIELMDLDTRFSQETLKGGGKVFASWFAPDALTLNNKRAPVMGKARIANTANWEPQNYQLSWVPSGGKMGPSNDMGYTWGHFEGRSKDSNGQPVVLEGRYITVWMKQPDGVWKVVLDASAEEPASDCCALPKP